MNGIEIEWVDRYSALGIPRPDPKTVCAGPCEGVGYYPEYDKTKTSWRRAHWTQVMRSIGSGSVSFHAKLGYETGNFCQSALACGNLGAAMVLR